MNKTRKRYKELDILRGVAVLLVIGRHVLYIPEDLPIVLKTIFLSIRQMGWIGIDLFFVLSGFLVSGLLFQEQLENGKVKTTRFLIRRAFKIYPSFYAFIFFTFLFSFISPFSPINTLRGYIGEIIFMQNYIGAIWGHTWTLAVEEHFYLILALIISLLVRIKIRDNPFIQIPKIICIFAVFLLLLRTVISFTYLPGHWWHIISYTHLRIDSLFFGVLISYFYFYHKELLKFNIKKYKLALKFLVIGALLLPILVPLENRFMYSVGFTILYLGFGSLLILSILSISKRKDRILKKMTPFAIVGKYSYSIYLWHMIVYHLISKVISPKIGILEFYMHTFIYFFGSLFVGMVTAKLIEFPALRVRERWFKSAV